MNTLNLASTINFLGFAVGIALYAILLVMVFRHPNANNRKTERLPFNQKYNLLLMTTAILGLIWNFISFFELARHDFLNASFSPYLSAAAFAALGFLPAVVVNSEWRTAVNKNVERLTVAAYFLSGCAAVLHFYNAAFFGISPSVAALWILTAGYLLVLAALFVLTRQTSIERKTFWATALAVFAVSAIHLSHPHSEDEKSWLIELVGHQASLAFVFVILYQNFRFAFADLFLKRAFSLVLLAALVFGLYVLIATPLLALHEAHPQPDAQQIAVIMILWMATAILYPFLHRFAVWLVDKIILRRADYRKFKKEIAQMLSKEESIEAILKRTKEKLAAVLTAGNSLIEESNADSAAGNAPLVGYAKNEAEISIATADAPQYKIRLRRFAGGRQLLSEEIEMLETIALEVARRIDVLRVSHERCESDLREREFTNLATEAELRALRAQINPHFLFNALTTIGYLINAAPERALQPLMQLTGLLRGVLRSTAEFQTLGEELKLIRAYLEIEQARFEERLTVEIDVPEELLKIRIPSLILQPIIENAVKHGISPKETGGTIRIKARREADKFVVRISDTGIGISETALRERRSSRVGLNNIEQRLDLYFNGAADLKIDSRIGEGTTIEIEIERSVLEAHQILRRKTEIGKAEVRF